MRLNKEVIYEVTEDIVCQAIKSRSGIRCTKEDFNDIVEFIDSHNKYQFVVASSHKDGYDYYVKFGYVDINNIAQ